MFATSPRISGAGQVLSTLAGPYTPTLARGQGMSVQSTSKVCSFPECGSKVLSRGLCACHYEQQRLGKPLTPRYATQRPAGSPPRIVGKETPCQVPYLEGPCLEFVGSKRNGYGRVGHNGKIVNVHCYVWERDVGPIPEGLIIDHQCRNRACFNVKHLRVVTYQTNAVENSVSPQAINAAKTHCVHGHPFDDANTMITKQGTRRCRTCCRLDARRRRGGNVAT